MSGAHYLIYIIPDLTLLDKPDYRIGLGPAILTSLTEANALASITQNNQSVMIKDVIYDIYFTSNEWQRSLLSV
jgi:hypothetical protein